MKAKLLKENYDIKLNNYWVASTEAMGFLQRYLDGNVPADGADEILATHHAEIFGQDGDKGAQKLFLFAKDSLNVANLENAENGLPLAEPTPKDIAMENEAHAGADIVDDAHYEFGKNGELSADLADRIRNFGIDQVESEDSVQ